MIYKNENHLPNAVLPKEVTIFEIPKILKSLVILLLLITIYYIISRSFNILGKPIHHIIIPRYFHNGAVHFRKMY